MATISSITLEQFRIHEKHSFALSSDTTIITGKNGSGKTSILEAIYIALQGTSFKASDKDCIRDGSEWFRIQALFDDNSIRSVGYEYNENRRRKQVVIDNTKKSRLTYKDKIPVILFEPNDLRLLHGSPERRRAFIDGFISQINPQYQQTLRKYERALKQRNNLLKNQNVQPDDVFVWDVALSEYGSEIISQREVYIAKINEQLSDIYRDIAQTGDDISLHYSHTYIGSVQQKLMRDLQEGFARDKVLGYTSSGPHRHDVIFRFNMKPALTVASRGEIRTIVIALKLLEAQILELVFSQKPIVLLDDLFSELDSDRQKYLSEAIRSHQIIITTTHLPDNTSHVHTIPL